MNVDEMKIKAEAHHLELVAYLDTEGSVEEVVQWRADEPLPDVLHNYEQVHLSLASPLFGIFLGLFHEVEVKELPTTISSELSNWLETVEKVREDMLQAYLGESIFGGKYTGTWCREEVKRGKDLYEFVYHRRCHTACFRKRGMTSFWKEVYRIPLEHLAPRE